WRGHEAALKRTVELAERCAFSLRDLQPRLPRFQGGEDGDDQRLHQRVELGAHQRYGADLCARHRAQIDHEMEVITSLGLSGYFLIVWDIVRFARERGILVQGRGSAANSVVCYCLGITAVDPVEMELLFERFLSRGRTDPPDIDLDIAHQDREEVLQYVYERYGRRHAAMVCETISYRGKSAVRDVAGVLGLEPELGGRLALQVGHCEAREAAERLAQGGAIACGLDPQATNTRSLIDVVARLDRLPRHRSIHVGGFVLTAEPLDTVAPLESASMADRTILQWDKDDLAPVGLVKIDLLGLGILTVIHRAFCCLRETRGLDLELSSIPVDDPAVYAQISEADTVGLFQIESRAQMNSLPRLRPTRFYDLVVQVAIIRPGPIQGEMVHPYIRRRRGEEPVTYLHPELKPVLERTLGVPLFQEQGMKVAITMAGFTPDQADRLRKIMGFKRATDHLEGLVRELWDGMMNRGVAPEVATRILGQLQGFASYGFPESHAASFALLVYASAWLRHHFAPEYLAATLNAQPMGFYGPSTLVEDAKRHGVEVRPVDLVFSHWDTTLETDRSCPAVRLGLRLVRGLSGAARDRLEAALSEGPLAGLQDLVSRADASGISDDTLLILARAGAFRTLWPGRRDALWTLLCRLRERHGALPLYRAEERGESPLRPMTLLEETAADYNLMGLSHQVHPMAFHRAALQQAGVLSSSDLREVPSQQRVQIAGLVICRQRPGSAKGVFFLTLEDEHGMMNVVVMPDLFEDNRMLLVTAPALLIEGALEHLQGVRNVLAQRFEALASETQTVPVRSHDFR
ncbi:MAG: error-prone DNA polymerase, partial [Myxococcota bacterium]|nr:error-prone DNA polymerase [Myxococcota bacterium]